MSLIKESKLPLPRMEFRWTKDGDGWNNRLCTYSLVIPLGELDIRRETENGKVDSITIELSTTNVRGGQGYPVKDDTIDTPFRDSAHAQWDSIHVGNPPIYAVCDGVAMLVEKDVY